MSGGNCTSTTGPVICKMVPVAPPALFPFADTTSVAIGIASGWVCTSVMMPPGSLVLAGHRIVGGAAHRHHPRRVLGGDPFQDRLVELDLDVARQQVIEHGLWARLEDVVRVSLLGFWRLDRKDLQDLWSLHQRVNESGIDH